MPKARNDYTDSHLAGLFRLPKGNVGAAIHVAPHMQLVYMMPGGSPKIRTSYSATTYDMPHEAIIGVAPLPHNGLHGVRRHGLGNGHAPDTGTIWEVSDWDPESRKIKGHPFAVGNVGPGDGLICRGRDSNAHRDPADHWSRFMDAPFNDHMVGRAYHGMPKAMQAEYDKAMNEARTEALVGLRDKALAEPWAEGATWVADRADPTVRVEWPPEPLEDGPAKDMTQECDPYGTNALRVMARALRECDRETSKKFRVLFCYRTAHGKYSMMQDNNERTTYWHNRVAPLENALYRMFGDYYYWDDVTACIRNVRKYYKNVYSAHIAYLRHNDTYDRDLRNRATRQLRTAIDSLQRYTARFRRRGAADDVTRAWDHWYTQVTLSAMHDGWIQAYGQRAIQDAQSKVQKANESAIREAWYSGAWRDGRSGVRPGCTDLSLWFYPTVGTFRTTEATHALLSDDPRLLAALPAAYHWPTGRKVAPRGGAAPTDRTKCDICERGTGRCTFHATGGGNTTGEGTGTVQETVVIGWGYKVPDGRVLLEVVGHDGSKALMAWDARGFRRYTTRDAIRGTPRQTERDTSHVARMRTLRGLKKAMSTQAGRKMARNLLGV